MHRIRAVPAIALVCLGCGRVGFEPASDAPTDGPADAPPACSAFSAWGPPVHLTTVSSASTDYGGQISRNGLDLYFASDRAGSMDIYETHRSSRTAPFPPAVAMPGVNVPSQSDEDVSISIDGLELFVGSDRGPSCIFRARRSSTSDSFSTLAPLGLCANGNASGAFLDDDGLVLYYNTLPDFGMPWGEIRVSTRASTQDDFLSGPAIVALQGDPREGFPALSSDGLTLYYETGSPDHHLWESTRPSRAAAFGPGTRLTGINGPNIDEDASITADGLELYFASDRPGTLGGPDLFFATRTCQP